MSKKPDVEKMALQFILDVCDLKFGTVSRETALEAEVIRKHICVHGEVKSNQYCHLCGWHNIARLCSSTVLPLM